MSTTRVALVTGGNKGIGLETCRQLAEQGITVFLGSRDEARGEAAAASLRPGNRDVRAIGLDVTSEASIEAAVGRIEREAGRLDILVNNAGVMRDVRGISVLAASIDDWRATFETNLFGLVAVTRACMPLLRRSPAPRLVNVTSILGSIATHLDPTSAIYGSRTSAYNASKSAVNAFTVQLALELKDTAFKVNAAHPGWVKTDLGGTEAPLDPATGAQTSVELALLGPDGPTGTYRFGERILPW